MTKSRRGRAPHRYVIRRIRLVNFHNLVDETIEIPEGGHLFLLGDNGSGKTTVLDAIHLVLTGTLEVELNAAARVAGGRDAGRSLQGVVLRYDAEHGVQQEGGAVTYAVLELLEQTEGTALCVGVGIEATTMEADVSRWAVIHRGGLDQVPILESSPDGPVPVSRDALRAVLGKFEVFARMSEYRKALTETLFGDEALYEEVCRFWTMAKAYREIVARSRDFAGLFMRLLPAPDAEMFGEILRSLRALDELELLVEQLARQRAYVVGLSDLVATIRNHREEMARYRWLLVHKKLLALEEQRARTQDEHQASALEVARLGAVLLSREAEVDLAREALRTAAASDSENILERLRHAEAQLARDTGDFELEAEALRSAEASSNNEERRAVEAFSARAGLWQERAAAFSAAVEAVRTLEHPLVKSQRLAASEQGLAAEPFDRKRTGDLPRLDPAASEEVRAVLAAAESLVRESEAQRAERAAELAALRSDLASLEAKAEELPQVAGFSRARAALTAAGVAAAPLFELLEPLVTAPESDLAAVETLAGDAALATFIVTDGDLEAVKARALPHEGARVAVRTAADAPLPGWIAELFTSRTPPEAPAILGTLLSQAPSLGSIASPDALGDVEHRGSVARAAGGTPRLIGSEARRRAHRARVRAAREAVQRAEAELATADSAIDAARSARLIAAGAADALEALRDAELLERHSALRISLAVLEQRLERAGEARSRHTAAEKRKHETALLRDALRARAHQAGLEELDRHLRELKSREVLAIDAHKAAQQRHAEAAAGHTQLERELETLRGQVFCLLTELGALGTALRDALGKSAGEIDDDALARYVKTTQRGDQFTSLENIEERMNLALRAEAAAVHEIGGDGSRGISNLEWAGKFGFSWSPADLRIEDRRGEPLGNVLAQIDRDLSAQREVVNEKTRELMDKLVMGDLARELQDQVERLNRTVREMNELLANLRFGTTRYQFRATPRSEVAELVSVIRKLSMLDDASRSKFREFVDTRLEDVRRFDRDSDFPELLDYRRWFDYRLAMRSSGEGDVELTRELRALGSGGEQGVPNYLLVLALAKLMFDNAGARVRPVLFDEAFYGIDAGRRDQLLRFATDLGLQLVIASPELDGVTPAARRTTTLFLVKDAHGDVHLAPYHYWNDSNVAQTALFAERPTEAPAEGAVCMVEPTPAVPMDDPA